MWVSLTPEHLPLYCQLIPKWAKTKLRGSDEVHQEMCEKMSNLISNLRKRNKSNTEIIGTFSAYNFNSDLTIELANYPAHVCVSLSLFSHHLVGKHTIWIRQTDSIKIEISLRLYTRN